MSTLTQQISPATQKERLARRDTLAYGKKAAQKASAGCSAGSTRRRLCTEISTQSITFRRKYCRFVYTLGTRKISWYHLLDLSCGNRHPATLGRKLATSTR